MQHHFGVAQNIKSAAWKYDVKNNSVSDRGYTAHDTRISVCINVQACVCCECLLAGWWEVAS